MGDVERVRAFNRTWTEVLGLLDGSLLHTDFSLAEARLIFELANQDRWERSALRSRLGMDASFMTRVLGRLSQRGLVVASCSPMDGRAVDLTITPAGRAAYAVLNARSTDQVDSMLSGLSADQRATMTESMTVLTHLLRPGTAARSIDLRGIELGDLGWIVERHGAIYHDEFGWDLSFEALVAGIVAEYATNLGSDRQHAWIAVVDGARAGSVLCCDRDASTAQLRLLLVEPWARGLNLGRRLVDECIDFARRAGYTRIVLWTNDVLVAARRIYERVGFVLVDEAPHHSFGHDLVGQNWQLELT